MLRLLGDETGLSNKQRCLLSIETRYARQPIDSYFVVMHWNKKYTGIMFGENWLIYS